MTISSNSQILVSDYNQLQSNAAAILNNYGLTYSATPVAGLNYYSYPLVGNPKIQAQDWARLTTDIKIAATHQGITNNSSMLSLTGASFTGVIISNSLLVSSVTGTISIGDPIWGSGVTPGTYITGGSGTMWTVSPSQSVSSRAMRSGGNIAAGDLITFRDSALWSPAITAITTNQYAVAQYSDESFSPDISNSRTTPWGGTTPSIYHTFTIDFSSTANKGKYFFNSGGNIRISGSRTLGSNTTQNTNWTSLFTNMGTVVFGYNSTTFTGTSGTGSSIGFFGLTNSNQTIFSAAGTGSYSTNTYVISARSDVANNSSGTARYVYVSIALTDTHTNAFTDTVDGTVTSTISLRRASGTAVSVTAPTASNTAQLADSTQITVFQVTIPASTTNGSCSCTVVGGKASESWSVTANSSTLGTFTINPANLSNIGYFTTANLTTFPGTGTWYLVFNFSQSGTFTRSIIIS